MQMKLSIVLAPIVVKYIRIRRGDTAKDNLILLILPSLSFPHRLDYTVPEPRFIKSWPFKSAEQINTCLIAGS